MASVSEGERRGRFVELLMGTIPEREPLFFPIFVALMGPRSGEQGEEDPPSSAADRIVLVNPLTQGMVVLRSSGGADLAAVVQEMMLAADGGIPRGPPPASKASIKAMGSVERPSGDGSEGGVEEECAVCLDGLWAAYGEVGVGEKGAAVKEMPCRHRFHGRCIEKWLGMHGSCPMCRHRMPEEEQPAGKKSVEEREEGEMEGGGSRTAEREIWVTFGFNRRAAEGDQQQQQQEQQPQQRQHQQQQHQEMEEESSE